MARRVHRPVGLCPRPGLRLQPRRSFRRSLSEASRVQFLSPVQLTGREIVLPSRPCVVGGLHRSASLACPAAHRLAGHMEQFERSDSEACAEKDSGRGCDCRQNLRRDFIGFELSCFFRRFGRYSYRHVSFLFTAGSAHVFSADAVPAWCAATQGLLPGTFWFRRAR
jgi:hypothetical protein